MKSRNYESVNIEYKPEIDGLRAISVLAVIFYHAHINIGEKQLIAGGFIGVDIFFVISGFLITSMIMSQINKFGTFSFSNFFYDDCIR